MSTAGRRPDEVTEQGVNHTSFIAVNSHHWAALSDMDAWAGVNVTLWTDPVEYGLQAKDVPVLLQLGGLGGAATDEDLLALLKELGVEHLAPDLRLAQRLRGGQPVLSSPDGKPPRTPNSPEIVPVWEEAFKDRTAAELDEIFGRHRAGVVPLNTYSTLMTWKQTPYLDIFNEVQHPTAGAIPITGSAWSYSVTPEDVTRRPAPLLGQHSEEVFESLSKRLSPA